MGDLLHVAVLMGGFSSERAVSLNSGKMVAQALRSLGLKVSKVDVRSKEFRVPSGTDIAFLALHGTGGEDGTVQGILEKKGIPFTSSGSKASRLAFDKVQANRFFRQKGLPTPPFRVLKKGKYRTLTLPFGFPCVVKPSCQGSSIGVSIVKHEKNLKKALDGAFRWGDHVLIEKFIEGRELTVGTLGERPLPVIEIRPKTGWFDYKNKYTKGATDELVPAPIKPSLARKAQKMALKAHRALGCRDVSRSDFRVDSMGKVWLLEVNTIPGMTKTSLLPKAAAAAGISFPRLCFDLVKKALKRRIKNERIGN